MTAQSIFVTGTDTGAGKTLISAALLEVLARRGMKVTGMKPVASGSRLTADGLRNDDAFALIEHSNVSVAYDLVNPYCFEPAIAPHIAAAEMKMRVDMGVLRDAHAQLAAQTDVVVIEGAGGWLTPLNGQETLADFAKAVEATVVLVVGLRLGCINHALLTARAIESDGLKLVGWIANTLQPDMPRAAENIQTLRERLRAPLLGVIPYNPQLTSAQAAQSVSLP